MDNQNNNDFFYNNFDFKNSAIIQPRSQQKKEEVCTKMKYILIDSRDRNMLKYPNSNKFTIHLDDIIKDVTEIELTKRIRSFNHPNFPLEVHIHNHRFVYKGKT